MISYDVINFSILLREGNTEVPIQHVTHKNEVLVPSFTFIGSCSPILHLKAKPIFFDVDNFHNIDEEKLVKFLKNNNKLVINFSICIALNRVP